MLTLDFHGDSWGLGSDMGHSVYSLFRIQACRLNSSGAGASHTAARCLLGATRARKQNAEEPSDGKSRSVLRRKH